MISKGQLTAKAHRRTPLLSFVDGLHADTKRRYWISGHVIDVNNPDIGDDMVHTVIEVKITLPMSHNTFTSAEEDIQP